MSYLYGFGNHHSTEAVVGALPLEQNSPQNCPFGLYAEQINASAFIKARSLNLHSWMYRLLPSVNQKPFKAYHKNINSTFSTKQSPSPLRFSPLIDIKATNFIDNLLHIAGNTTLNTYIYNCSESMQKEFFVSYDGEWLIIPYLGKIKLHTELGLLEISPGMIAVIPRGILFKVEISAFASGYICENSGIPLKLPDLGLIGANGLAHSRHFFYPTAKYEDNDQNHKLICKSNNNLFIAELNHSPMNVVAWHGNYAPYAYDLYKFNAINTVSFDHPDPSIFTVLSSDSDTKGTPNLDFVLFSPRWMVAEHTFRPPYFHRNIMNELMGLISGTYDAKAEGFTPGGISIHNQMTPHGPDLRSYQYGITQKLSPQYYDNTLAFMLEAKEPWKITEFAIEHPALQNNYTECWQGFQKAKVPKP